MKPDLPRTRNQPSGHPMSRVARSRPPLPGGPYLVVGLARSGVAAALTLRERGEEVIGLDSGAATAPPLVRPRQEGFRRPASKSTSMCQVRPLPPGPGRSSRAPVSPQTPPSWRRRGPVACPVLGEIEFAWRLLANEFIAVTGTNGKTTTTEWIGHIHREAARPVAVAGNVGTALSVTDRRSRPRGHGRLRSILVSARGHRGVRPRSCRAAQSRARSSGPARHL